MVTMSRVRVNWNGFPGAPGINTFYFADPAIALPPLHALYTSLAPRVPMDVALTIDSSGDTIDSLTGKVNGQWAAAAQPGIQGSSNMLYASPAGVLLKWGTSAITDGRRIRGKTFLVPMAPSNFDAGGNTSFDTQTVLTGYLGTFIGAMPANMLIWQRPRLSRNAYSDGRGILHKAILSRIGGAGVVVTGSVGTKAAILSSRRD